MPTSSILIKRAQYHETDSMRIVHHSNYVKWMEEARVEFFHQTGFDWKNMEETKGIMIPVLFQSVEYIHAIRFDECIKIVCSCDKFNGVKMNFSYVFCSLNDKRVLAKGITKHGFIDSHFNPVMLKKVYLEGYNAINSFIK